MAALTDIAGPALASCGGLGFLIWIGRILLDDRASNRAQDRPLARTVAALERERDAKNDRIAELELEVDDLHDQVNKARSERSTADDRASSAERRLAEAQATIEALRSHGGGQRR